MTVCYLIINIPEIYLITLANSVLHRAESETIKNSFIFLAAWKCVFLEKCSKRTSWHRPRHQIWNQHLQFYQNPLKTLYMSKNKVNCAYLGLWHHSPTAHSITVWLRAAHSEQLLMRRFSSSTSEILVAYDRLAPEAHSTQCSQPGWGPMS